MTRENDEDLLYADYRYGRQGKVSYFYLMGLASHILMFIFGFVVAIGGFITGYGDAGIAGLIVVVFFGSIAFSHTRAALAARRLIQCVEDRGDHIWIRLTMDGERLIRRDEIQGYGYSPGREWHNFFNVSFMDNADRDNIVIRLKSGEDLYVFNDGEQAQRLVNALQLEPLQGAVSKIDRAGH